MPRSQFPVLARTVLDAASPSRCGGIEPTCARETKNCRGSGRAIAVRVTQACSGREGPVPGVRRTGALEQDRLEPGTPALGWGRRQLAEDGLGISSQLSNAVTPSIERALVVVENARVAASSAALVLVRPRRWGREACGGGHPQAFSRPDRQRPAVSKCRRPARRSLRGTNVSAPESGSRERPSWADGAPRVACAGLEPVSAKLKGRGQLTPALRAIEAQDRAGAAERLRKVREPDQPRRQDGGSGRRGP